MTRHGSYVLQPDGFRVDDVPAWVHFPKLHLLLGWGPGLWETLEARIAGLRHVFAPTPADSTGPPIAGVMDWRYNYHQFSVLREHAPSLAVEGVGAACVRFDFGPDGGVIAKPHPCGSGASHPIVPDGEYRVRHDFGDAGVSLTLERRTKALKPAFREKLAALGLEYAPGTGKRDAKPDGRRTSAEQAFVEHVSRMKAAYVTKRTKELIKEPSRRPADFDERVAAHARARLGEIQRKKRDGRGMPKRPWKHDDLIARICGEIARLEATDLLFDYGARDVALLGAQGFSLLSP